MAEYEFKSSISSELEGFMQFCKKSYADHTYRMYYGHMKSFDQHLYEHGFSGGYIPEELVDGWLASLQGYRDFTISSYINTLRGFLRFRAGLGGGGYVPPSRKKTYDYTPYIFSDEETVRICSIADNYVIVLEKHKNKTTNGKSAHKHSACLFSRNSQTLLKRLAG